MTTTRPCGRTLRGIASATATTLLLLSTPVRADKIKHPTAVFSGLDKITGRIISFEVATNETVQFGSLQITERVCYTRPPTEAPQTTTFVEVDEVDASNQYKRLFSGWMYAASPGLHGIEHPVYDIWLTDCKGGSEVIATPPETASGDQPAAAPPPPDNAAKTPVKPVQKPRRVQPQPPPSQDPDFDQPPDGFGRGGQGDVLRPPAAIPTPRRTPSQRFYPTDNGPGYRQDPAGGGGY
jgi:hypothetical protein